MLTPFLSGRLPFTSLMSLAVVAAVASSTIVVGEPAPTDLAMGGVMMAALVLGIGRWGRHAQLNFAAWAALVAIGLVVTGMSVTPKSAIMHQVVTLFLALGAFVVAGYVAEDPVPRFRLVMQAYVAACLIGAVLGLVGYFRLLPGAEDHFTSYGRARGAFKDPNVLGAALAPGMIYCLWVMLREAMRAARIAFVVMLVLAFAMLVSFSRGAWLSLAVSLVIFGWIVMAGSRRRSDRQRMLWLGGLGGLTLLVGLAAVVQLDSVGRLLSERASLDQSYDHGRDGRFGGQAKARALIVENPLGIGTHTFREAHHAEEPHNVYLSQFLNAGWIGGVIYIATVLATLFAGLKGCLRLGVLHGPFVVVTAAFAGLCVEGFIIDSDHWRHFFLMAALIWGLADAGRPPVDASRRRDDDASARHPAQ